MIDPWSSWAESPPPVFPCSPLEGCNASLQLVVIDEDGDAFVDVFRAEDGQCHCVEGGRIANVKYWTYAPGVQLGGDSSVVTYGEFSAFDDHGREVEPNSELTEIIQRKLDEHSGRY